MLHVIRQIATIAVCLALVGATAALDGYLGQGGVWGNATSTTGPTARGLGANTFLHLEADRAKVDQTARMLRAAGITIARQQFAWNEIEPREGVFRDERTGRDSWEKYDYLVEALAREGVQVLARVENTPAWARTGEDTAAAPFGPPRDFDRYAAFAGQVVSRYKGKIAAVQVWNEPNVRREWGERPPDPAAYVDLLTRTRVALKAADPAVVVVAAGLAPTDGLDASAANDISFLEGMYEAGAKGQFDAMAVMIYGLGQSPDDRRLGLRHPINFSRPILTRAVMERYGDGVTPVWASEYGWASVPPAWTGRPSTWGPSIDEEQQARYLVRGLQRMRDEWPWMGVVCVWAFRFVESTMDPADPQRHFAIVRDDFSPRPAYLALAARPWRDVAAPGVYTIGDPLVQMSGSWRTQTLGGRQYRLVGGRDAQVILDFTGDRVAALARVSAQGGRLFVAIDGQPVPGLPTVSGRSYVTLQAARTNDAEVLMAAGLRPGRHQLELTPGDGEIALAGLVVAHERPFGWAFSLLHGGALAGLAWALGALFWSSLCQLGVISPLLRPRPRRFHGWR